MRDGLQGDLDVSGSRVQGVLNQLVGDEGKTLPAKDLGQTLFVNLEPSSRMLLSRQLSLVF